MDPVSMEASQKLALFRNIDFDVATTTSNEESEKTRLHIAKSVLEKRQFKTQQNRKKKLKRKSIAQNTQSQLDSNELLFFPDHLDVRPRDKVPLSNEEKHREDMYKLKIGKMTDIEQRQFRAKRDIRYLHKQNDEPPPTESSTADLPCLHHVAGKCEHRLCIYNHQMRLPRQFGVCRFYLKNACTKGNACTHMHSEFPCKFYYLGMPHPNNIDTDNCRFTHGDVLNENTKRFFLKQIEFWVKEKCASNADDFERQMNEMIARFEAQEQKILNERHRQQETAISNGSLVVVSTAVSTETAFVLSKILNEAQIRRLAADKITSIDQLQQMSMAKLETYRITMDQIFEIKSKRLKVDKAPIDDAAICDDEKTFQSVLPSTDVAFDSHHIQSDAVNVDHATGDGDTNETQSAIQNTIIEKQFEDNSDKSDSDSEDRLVINDEL